MIRAKAEKARQKGREFAEAAFLEFHGLWTEEAVSEAEKLLETRIVDVGLVSLVEAQAMAVEAFAVRLRELIEHGQSAVGQG